MKIYYSNIASIEDSLADILPGKIGVLESYYGMRKVNIPKYCDSYFLDSGAFSAWNQGTSIDVNKYIGFIKENKKFFDVYASLDDLLSDDTSVKNYNLMLKADLTPMPTFHHGEDFSVLDYYVSTTDYIALGKIAKANKKDRVKWLDQIFSKFPDSKKIGFHGFGVQDEELLKRYPWRSVDASSVHVIARYGGIYTPWGALKINPAVNARELRWATKGHLEKVDDYVQSLGFSFEKAREHSVEGVKIRSALNVIYFENISEEYKDFHLFEKKLNTGFGL